jgi:hypothetical protein
LVSAISGFDIKLQSGKTEAMKKAKDGTIQAVFLGVSNALSGGRSDFNSNRVKAAIEKAAKLQSFPAKIKFKTTAKGHQLFVEKEQ